MNPSPETNPLFGEVQAIVSSAGLPELDATPRPDTKSISRLEQELEPIFTKADWDAEHQQLILGAALLWHDHWDASHRIAQEIETPDGSLLHAILHRREPDFGNSRYWFRRAGSHPSYKRIGPQIEQVLGSTHPDLVKRLVRNGAWDPMAFVELCESSTRSSTVDRSTLRQLQQLEMDGFLEHLTQAGAPR